MSADNRCPECGTEVPEGAGLLNLCPRCLLKQALPGESTQVMPESDAPQNKRTGLPEQFGAYRPVGVLGEGGMGIVYLAEQDQPIRRRVALKVIKQGMDTRQIIARFESERQAVALMDHPNIARVYDAGATPEGRPYFAMEYVPGIPITDYCDKYLLGTRDRLELFMQVCNAIQHAHQKGVIHRDIKPSNVLVMQQDGKPVPKVIDFGVAKATNQRLTEKTMFTELGVLIGTPAYMSPEQAEMTGLDVDTTTDIYSLGVLLYELLVGSLPFDPQSLRKAGYDEIRRIIREVEPPRPTTMLHSLGAAATEVARRRHTDVRTLLRLLRGDLEWISMKALEKDRTRRYASASEFAADLLRHLSDEAVQASPPSAVYRAGKFVRKNKGPFIAVLAVFVSLVMGLVASTILYIRAEYKSVEAQAQRAEAERQRAEAIRQRLEAESQRAEAVRQRLEAERQQTAAQRERAEAERQGQEAKDARSLTDQERIRADHERLKAESQAQEAERQRLIAQEQSGQALKSSADAVRARDAEQQQRLKADQSAREAEDRRAEAERSKSQAQRAGYEASLAAADAQLLSNDVAGAKRSLLQCPVNLRGWEWRYLAWKADSSQAAVFAHDVRGSPSAPLAISADGAKILWASGEALYSWASYSWASQNYSPSPEYRGFDRILAFNKDGSRIVAASAQNGDSTLTVYEAATRRRVATFTGHVARPVYAAFSQDGAHIASASIDGQGAIWDAASGKISGTLKGHAGAVSSIAFSKDGQRIVSGGTDKTVRLWDAASGQILYTKTDHSGAVLSVTIDRARNRIFSGSADGTVRIWAANTMAALQTLTGHGGRVSSVASSPDGATMASASGKTVRLWDADSGKLLAILHADWGADIHSLVFTADSARILAMSEAGELKAWDVSTYGRTIFTRTGGPLLEMSPDGKPLMAVQADSLLRQFLAARGLNANLPGEAARITAFAVSGDGSRIVTASEAAILRVWELKPVRQIVATDLREHIFLLAVSSDGKRIATAIGNRSVEIRDAGNGSVLRQWPLPANSGQAAAMTFSPDGKRVAVGTEGSGQIGVWDAATGRLLVTLTGHVAKVSDLQFTPDGSRIVSGSSDHTVRIWDAETYDMLLVLRDHEDPVTSLVFSPDGARLYSASSVGTVRIWEAPLASRLK